MKSFLIRLEKEDYETLKTYSKVNKRSLASTIRYAISRLLNKDG